MRRPHTLPKASIETQVSVWGPGVESLPGYRLVGWVLSGRMSWIRLGSVEVGSR